MPALGFGECSEPLDEAVEDAHGETPEDAVVRSTDWVPDVVPDEPLIENGAFRFAAPDPPEGLDKILAALEGGITPLKPPSLWYVSNKDMSPEAKCVAP